VKQVKNTNNLIIMGKKQKGREKEREREREKKAN